MRLIHLEGNSAPGPACRRPDAVCYACEIDRLRGRVKVLLDEVAAARGRCAAIEEDANIARHAAVVLAGVCDDLRRAGVAPEGDGNPAAAAWRDAVTALLQIKYEQPWLLSAPTGEARP